MSVQKKRTKTKYLFTQPILTYTLLNYSSPVITPAWCFQIHPKRSFRSLLAEVLCLSELLVGKADVFTAVWTKLWGLKKGLACTPKPLWTDDIPMADPCIGVVWEGWLTPNWFIQGDGVVVPGAGFGVIWFRLTLGLLGVKRESKADISGFVGWAWPWFCISELKLGVLVVVAMPPYMAGVDGHIPRPNPIDGKPMGAVRPLLMGSIVLMPPLVAVRGKAVDVLLLWAGVDVGVEFNDKWLNVVMLFSKLLVRSLV